MAADGHLTLTDLAGTLNWIDDLVFSPLPPSGLDRGVDLFRGDGQALDADAYGVFDGVGYGGGYWGYGVFAYAFYVVGARSSKRRS